MRKFIVLIVLSFLVFAGCSSDPSQQKVNNTKQKKVDIKKPMSWGHKQTIYVFADNNVWKFAERHLRDTLERYYFTTENEPYFDVKRAPLDKLEQFYKFNNLIFLADLESSAPVSAYVKTIMGSAIETEIAENKVGMYPKENIWARDQFVLFLIGNNERNLLNLNISMAEETFQQFKQKLFERISFLTYKSKTYLKSTFNNYTWEMDIPKTYTVYKQDDKNNFISFLARLRNKPDRYISIYSEDMIEDYVDDNWLKEKRKELAWKYYDEDEYFDKDVRIQPYEIGKKQGRKLSGRWQNKKYAVGGAFQSFAFYDEIGKKAYLIDNSIYFPEGFKLAGLIETEVISQTIKIKN